MFDWIKRCFGEGKLRIEFTTVCGNQGIVKVPYIGQYNERDALDAFKQEMLVEHGLRVKTCRIIGHIVK